MVDIFEYLDYRKFLRDIYEFRRSQDANMTYRYLAKTVGFNSAGFFTLIIQGKRNVSNEMIPKFAMAFKLKIKEREYFQYLVQADQAKNHTEKKYYLDKALTLKRIKFKIKDVGAHKFYEKWYYSAIREMLSFMPYKNNAVAFARYINPPLRPFQVEKAIELLSEINLISKSGDGYKQNDPYITSGDEITSATLAKYHLETADLAKRAIDKANIEERNISTLTLALSKNGFEEVTKRIREFRRELMDISKADLEKDQVFHLNLQLFPMTKKRKFAGQGKKVQGKTRGRKPKASKGN